jgi:hypothetical protein
LGRSHDGRLFARKVGRKGLLGAGGVDRELDAAVVGILHECAAEEGVLRGSGRLAKRLALLRRERGNGDETDDVFGLRRRIRNHRAAVGVTDRDHRALDLLKDFAR